VSSDSPENADARIDVIWFSSKKITRVPPGNPVGIWVRPTSSQLISIPLDRTFTSQSVSPSAGPSGSKVVTVVVETVAVVDVAVAVVDVAVMVVVVTNPHVDGSPSMWPYPCVAEHTHSIAPEPTISHDEGLSGMSR